MQLAVLLVSSRSVNEIVTEPVGVAPWPLTTTVYGTESPVAGPELMKRLGVVGVSAGSRWRSDATTETRPSEDPLPLPISRAAPTRHSNAKVLRKPRRTSGRTPLEVWPKWPIRLVVLGPRGVILPPSLLASRQLDVSPLRHNPPLPSLARLYTTVTRPTQARLRESAFAHNVWCIHLC